MVAHPRHSPGRAPREVRPRAADRPSPGRLHPVSVQTERRISLPPDARSPGRARRLVADALDDPAYDAVVDSAVLLTSELSENAVLHAGTEFEVEVRADASAVTITVSDRGSGPLEEHLAQELAELRQEQVE